MSHTSTPNQAQSRVVSLVRQLISGVYSETDVPPDLAFCMGSRISRFVGEPSSRRDHLQVSARL